MEKNNIKRDYLLCPRTHRRKRGSVLLAHVASYNVKKMKDLSRDKTMIKERCTKKTELFDTDCGLLLVKVFAQQKFT